MDYNVQPPKDQQQIHIFDLKSSFNQEKWDSCKADIRQIYMVEDKTLKITMSIIQRRHGLNASERKWKMKLEEWGFKKYKKRKITMVAEMTSTNSKMPANATYHLPTPEHHSSSSEVPEDAGLGHLGEIGESSNCHKTTPICNNCRKHSLECKYPSPVARPSLTKKASLSSLNIHQAIGTLNILDLELLGNFYMSTCDTLDCSPIKKTMWQIYLPKIAISFDFVMHTILALSGLHLASLQPEKKDYYTAVALSHHQIGLRTARIVLENLTDENCFAVYIFSVLTVRTAIAMQRKSGFLFFDEKGLADWVLMLRGVKYILDGSYEAFQSGPQGSMFQEDLRRVQLQALHPNTDLMAEPQLKELQRLISETTDLEWMSIYAEAIEGLHKSFTVLYIDKASYGATDVFAWVYCISDEYLDLLRRQTQESLCIFAFFCVLLHQLDSCWWSEGWSTHLMTQIYLALDDEHRRWIRWPIHEIGYVLTDPVENSN